MKCLGLNLSEVYSSWCIKDRNFFSLLLVLFLEIKVKYWVVKFNFLHNQHIYAYSYLILR